jgi:hypothetical protein
MVPADGIRNQPAFGLLAPRALTGSPPCAFLPPLAAFLLPVASAQSAHPSCHYSLKQAAADLTHQATPAKIISFKGADAQKITAVFNGMPPQSAIKSDELIVLYHPALPIVAVLFGRKGCSVAIASPWSVRKVEGMITQALGTGV